MKKDKTVLVRIPFELKERLKNEDGMSVQNLVDKLLKERFGIELKTRRKKDE